VQNSSDRVTCELCLRNTKTGSEVSDIDRWAVCINTGCFIMLSVITNIYNKKTKGPTLMEVTDHCSSEEYRCTHVDACVART
jgi:hypothetical protein